MAGLQLGDQRVEGLCGVVRVPRVAPAPLGDRADEHLLGGGQVPHELAAGELAQARRPAQLIDWDGADEGEGAAADAREIKGSPCI